MLHLVAPQRRRPTLGFPEYPFATSKMHNVHDALIEGKNRSGKG